MAPALDDQYQGHDNVTDGENGEIGWRVVGAIRLKRLIAARTMALHLQKAGEQGTLAAARASTGPAAKQCGPEIHGGVFFVAHPSKMGAPLTFVGVTVCPEGALDARPDAAAVPAANR